jgi:hypothetical protein
VVLALTLFCALGLVLFSPCTGSTRDYLAIASDSGRIVIVEFSAEKNMFVKVHQETFNKSGCRRLVPGQYLAADPKGRAVLIGTFIHTWVASSRLFLPPHKKHPWLVHRPPLHHVAAPPRL